jgi:hypothetical protein
MRFLKTLTLNRRAIYDDRLAINTDSEVVMNTPTNLLLPKGTGDVEEPAGSSQNQRPVSPTTGMIRYNTSTDQFEGYQAGSWRQFRFKEPTNITQQNLGAGNDEEIYFGPLNPSPVSYVSLPSGWDPVQIAKNMLVLVENVVQLSGANHNYTVVQNPSIGAEVYSPVTSVSLSSGATVLYFNTALAATGASGDTSTVTLTFSTRAFAPFSVGSIIEVSEFVPATYNGTYTVTACDTTSVSFASANTDTMTFAGQITSTDAVYPSVNFNGSIITGSASLQAGTTITSFTTDDDTDALVSVTFTSEPTTDVIADDVTLTITESTTTGTGYYLKFNSPVPDGKIVTALIGFDQ